MSRRKTISSSWRKEGFHNWKEAWDAVNFLSHRHRHMFWFEVEIDVEHGNREIEFILFGREMKRVFDKYEDPATKALEFGSMSMEMIAEELIDYIDNTYPGRSGYCRVMEDGENGGRVYFG